MGKNKKSVPTNFVIVVKFQMTIEKKKFLIYWGNVGLTLVYGHIKCGHTQVKNLSFHPWPFLARPQRLEKRQWEKSKKKASAGARTRDLLLANWMPSHSAIEASLLSKQTLHNIYFCHS